MCYVRLSAKQNGREMSYYIGKTTRLRCGVNVNGSFIANFPLNKYGNEIILKIDHSLAEI